MKNDPALAFLNRRNYKPFNQKSTRFKAAYVVAATLMVGTLSSVALPAYAHHSHASLDLETIQTWEGTVTEYIWKSPHLYIKAEAENANGKLMEYTIEALNPPSMASLGWGRDTFKKGDFIRWAGNPDRDPDRAYSGITWAEKEDGTRVSASFRDSINAKKASRQNAVVTPATKIGEGIWERVGADGGRFKPIYTPSTEWPLNAKGQEVVDNFHEDENPIKKCIHTGPPRSIVTLLGYKWDRPDEDTVTIHRDLWPHPRVIHLNGTSEKGEPTTFGYSVGRFEGDDLIVETDNFLAEKWGNYTGIDSSAEKNLYEHYSLSEDGKTLRVKVTVNDPVYLTEPYIFTHQWAKIPDRPLTDAECTLETANLYLTAGYGDKATPQSGVRQVDAPQIEAVDGDDAAPARSPLNPIFLAAGGFIIFLIGMGIVSRRRRSTDKK